MLAAMLAAMLASRPAAAADCGDADAVEVAEMKWPTAALLAQVHRLILERGYGCNVRLVRGAMKGMVTRLAARGRPDIVPEVWPEQVGRVWRQALDAGRAYEAAFVIRDGVFEGWWIPKFFADEHPDLKSVRDLKRYKEAFKDPNVPQMGRLYSCPATWLCAIVNRNLLRAYGLDGAFRAHSPAAGGELAAAIAKAYVDRRPVLVYHWSPAAVLGRYPMVALKMSPFNARGHECNSRSDCTRPHPGSYPVSQVVTAVATGFAKRAPRVVPYLKRMRFDRDTLNELLAWQLANRASARLTAEHFMREYAGLWRRWLPRDVADAIEESLQ